MDARIKDKRPVDRWLYAIYLDGVGRERRTPAQEKWLHEYLFDEDDIPGDVSTSPQPSTR